MGRKKISPISREERAAHTHTFTIRVHPYYNEWLENLSYRSAMDKVQLIRLLIHLAPWNKEFMDVVESYIRADRRHITVANHWQQTSDLWKWAR